MAKPILIVNLSYNTNKEDAVRIENMFIEKTNNEYYVITKFSNDENVLCINPDNTVNDVDVQELIKKLKP